MSKIFYFVGFWGLTYYTNAQTSIPIAPLDKVFINEIAPKGTFGVAGDWIELYNGNTVAVATDSIFITGKRTNPFKWRLKNQSIPANGFLRLIADKDTLAGVNHVDLKLSDEGESLFLFQKVGGAPVELASFEYPAMAADDVNVTFGTATDGVLNPKIANLTKFIGGTPNASNVGGKHFLRSTNSLKRGIIQIPQTITLTPPAGATIRYTTNLTQPSRINGMIYTQPIVIKETTILKIFTYDAKGESNVETFTYINPVKGSELRFPNLVTAEAYATGLKQLPIISISTLPGGGAVDAKIEQICTFEYMDKFGETGSAYAMGGVEGYGNSSYKGSLQKNLRVHFKSLYGYSDLKYPIFKKDEFDAKNPNSKFDVLELKVGQDGPNYAGYGMLMTSQGLITKTMRELGNIDAHTQYIHAFVNGKYHGVYVLKEKYDEHLAATYYGGKKEQYDVVESSWSTGILSEGNLNNWTALRTAAAQKRFQDVKKYMNVPNYIDFMILTMFFDNDWEYRAVADRNLLTTKFVFEVHDTDGALTKGTDENSYNYVNKWKGSGAHKPIFLGPGGIFGNLVAGKNKEFVTLVRDRVYEAIQKPNAALTTARITKKLEDLKMVIRPVFDLELARFNQNTYSSFDREYSLNLTFLPARYQFNLGKWLERGLAHTLMPVTFSQPSGNVTEAVTATNPNNKGIIYYTTDGSDPMGNDGVINSTAKIYAGGLELKPGLNTIIARVYWNGDFGAKTNATYKNTGVATLRRPIQAQLFDNQSFTIAPNPAYDYVDIDMTAANEQSVELIIFNNLGQMLMRQQVEHFEDKYRLSLDGLNAGHYILSIQVDGQDKIARKLMINR
jgi:Fn3 associated/CotH kinase protein/Secretion system C-terminal sorting domain